MTEMKDKKSALVGQGPPSTIIPFFVGQIYTDLITGYHYLSYGLDLGCWNVISVNNLSNRWSYFSEYNNGIYPKSPILIYQFDGSEQRLIDRMLYPLNDLSLEGLAPVVFSMSNTPFFEGIALSNNRMVINNPECKYEFRVVDNITIEIIMKSSFHTEQADIIGCYSETQNPLWGISLSDHNSIIILNGEDIIDSGIAISSNEMTYITATKSLGGDVWDLYINGNFAKRLEVSSSFPETLDHYLAISNNYKLKAELYSVRITRDFFSREKVFDIWNKIHS